MARPLRIEFEGAIYHVLARGNARQVVFRNDGDRAKFLELLERSCHRYEVTPLVFVLMANHFHLVAQTRRANLSRWMHWLMVTYTVYFNWRYQRSGHLFQGRYKSFLVEQGEYLLEVSRYLHLNPVRGKTLGRGTPAERRQRLRRYRWSSYPGYAGLAKGWRWMNEHIVLGEIRGSSGGRHVRYRRFVEEGLLREISNPLEAVRWQVLLGSESFVRRIQDKFGEQKSARKEIIALRRGGGVVTPEAVLHNVAEHYGVPVKKLLARGGYALEARNVALWLVWEKCGLTLREIGELFGGLQYDAVGQRIRRLKPTSRKEAVKLATKMSNVKI